MYFQKLMRKRTVCCIAFLTIFFFLLHGMDMCFFHFIYIWGTSFNHFFFKVDCWSPIVPFWCCLKSWEKWHQAVTSCNPLGEGTESLAMGTESPPCAGACCGKVLLVGVQCPHKVVSLCKRGESQDPQRRRVSPGGLFSPGLQSHPLW